LKNLVAKLLIVRGVGLAVANAAAYLALLAVIAVIHRQNLTKAKK
jgi:hypothetical protein